MKVYKDINEAEKFYRDNLTNRNEKTEYASDCKKYAEKFGSVGSIPYFCDAKDPDYGTHSLQTLFGRIPVALLLPQSWVFGEIKGVRPFLYTYN